MKKNKSSFGPVFGRKRLFGEKGFTLVELLVVVLIIAILAAIALPQYQKSVLRAQTRKMIVDVKAMAEAQHSYYLEHGSYPNKFSDLDVVPNGYPSTNCSNFGKFSKTDCISNENSTLLISNTDHSILALFNKGKYLYSGFVHLTSGEIYCYRHPNGNNHFCTKVLNCTQDTTIGNSANYYFTCPSL